MKRPEPEPREFDPDNPHDGVYCADCHRELLGKERDEPCPRCGSRSQSMVIVGGALAS